MIGKQLTAEEVRTMELARGERPSPFEARIEAAVARLEAAVERLEQRVGVAPIRHPKDYLSNS